MLHLKNGITVPSPSNFMLFLTQDCQLRCTYCFEDHRKNEQMSLATAIKAVDFLYRSTTEDKRTPSVSLFGGEPLLRWGEVIVPLITYIRDNFEKFGISMTTNGLLLDSEKLQFLQDNEVKLMLSIDGAEKGHNATRAYVDGCPTFEDLLPTIDLLIEKASHVPFRMTVTPSNVQYFYDSVEWFHNRGVQNFRAFPNVYEEWSADAIAMLDKQLQLYNKYIYDCVMSGQRSLIIDTYEYYFKKILIKQYEEANNSCRTSYFCQTCNRCGIGLLGNFMCNYKGDIFTCDRYVIADEANPCFVGNLDDGVSIEKIDRLYELNNARSLYNPNLECDTCPLNTICSGGCVPVNYQLTGDFTQVPSSYCNYNRILYKNVVDLLNIFEKEAASESFKAYFQEVAQRRMIYVG